MANHQTAGRPAETAVGDQRHRFTQASPDQCRGDPKHLAHSRAAPGALVADHHHIARLDLPCDDRRKRILLAIEDAGRTPMAWTFVAGGLHHASLRGEIAPKNRQAAGGSQRRREWAYHLLRGCLFRSDSVLGPGGPICGARLAVEELTGDQPLSHQARASRPIEIHRDEPAAGFQVRKQRGTPTDPVEILELERKLGLPRNRQQVEDRVGGTAGSRHTGNRVLE